MIEDRRKYKRVTERLRIIYKIDGEQIEGSSYSVDVSAGGFCIGLDRVIKEDTVLELLVYLPDNEKAFACKGRVSWQKTPAVKAKDGNSYFDTGISFESLDLKNRLRLIYYVHEKLKKNRIDEEKK
jgi:hypothetical protein